MKAGGYVLHDTSPRQLPARNPYFQPSALDGQQGRIQELGE